MRDLAIEKMVSQPNSVAEQGTLGKRARWVDAHDADRRFGSGAQMAHERAYEAALAHAGRAGHSDDARVARAGIQLADDSSANGISILDQRDGASERTPITAANSCGQLDRVGRYRLGARGTAAAVIRCVHARDGITPR